MSGATDGVSAPIYRRVRVTRLIKGRYGANDRPNSWDQRLEGIDEVAVDDGEVVKLRSTPMQSPPKSGWVLMLKGGNAKDGFLWTLYGMPRAH